jgi:MFS family permease
LFVTQYWQLFVLRTLTGIAVGGALPLVFSIAGDLFPSTSRSYASSMVGLCMHLGAMCGQGAAGFLGPSYGWRLPFAVVAVPGLLVAWAVATFALEPKRGGVEGGASAAAAAAAASASEEWEPSGSGSATLGSSSSSPSSSPPRPPSSSLSLSAFARGAMKKSGAVFRRPTNVMGFLQGIPGWGCTRRIQFTHSAKPPGFNP